MALITLGGSEAINLANPLTTLATMFTIKPNACAKVLIAPLLDNAEIRFDTASCTFLNALTTALIAPLSFNPFHRSLATVITFFIDVAILLITLSTLIPSKKLPNLFAKPLKSTFSKASIIPEIAFIPNLLNLSNAGWSLIATVSFNPSTAWSTVLNWVAIFMKSVLLPTFLIASKKSSVLTLPSWTFLTNSWTDIPISLAIAPIAAGAWSSINLKSCHATLGFAAICVACVLKVFIACLGFSAEAAKPPKPVTNLSVSLIPTAANCE